MPLRRRHMPPRRRQMPLRRCQMPLRRRQSIFLRGAEIPRSSCFCMYGHQIPYWESGNGSKIKRRPKCLLNTHLLDISYPYYALVIHKPHQRRREEKKTIKRPFLCSIAIQLNGQVDLLPGQVGLLPKNYSDS